MIDCDEWKAEKRHECTNMGQIKRLELWWQLYVMWLPGRDVRNFRPMDFCSSECTKCTCNYDTTMVWSFDGDMYLETNVSRHLFRYSVSHSGKLVREFPLCMVKVKVTLGQATKAQRGSRGIALLFLNLALNRSGCSTPRSRPLYPPGRPGTFV